LHFIRDPFSLLRSPDSESNPLQQRPPRCLASVPLTLSVLRERASLLAVIDMLVQWKCLQMHRKDAARNNDVELIQHIDRDLQLLRNNAVTQLGIRDLEALWQDCFDELVSPSSPASKTPVGEKEGERYSESFSKYQNTKRIASFVTKHSITKDDRVTHALGMLRENLDMLKGELVRQLGYSVTARDEDAVVLHGKVLRWNQIIMYSICVALPLLGVWTAVK